MTQAKKLIIIGAGGAGLESLEVVQHINRILGHDEWEVAGFVDDAASKIDRSIGGQKVLGTVDKVFESEPRTTYFHCAIGSNEHRLHIARQLTGSGFMAATLVDPSAVVSLSARLGAGCYVAPQVFIGPRAIIGSFVLINTGASLGHDACLGDATQVCPGGRVSGHARMEEGAFLGSNAVVTPNILVGAWSTVGACSLAYSDIPSGTTALGIPAKTVTPPAHLPPLNF
jgi:sugar O-acyltransferase (sialic acid O-acetyltransferase NeuD family)